MFITPGPSRRNVLQFSTGAAIAVASGCASTIDIPRRDNAVIPEMLARDETYWTGIARAFDTQNNITNVENGYWGVMAKPILAAFQEKTNFLNRQTSLFARGDMRDEMNHVYQRLSKFLGVNADELLLTRNATESLQILIGGYNKLRPGDGILYTDLDYSAMKSAMSWLADRRGVNVHTLTLPEPASHDEVIETYINAFDAHPDLKMILLTHVNNHTGAIHPVREIAAIAKERGIDVILDSAHAIGQIDFSLPDMNADFIGMNLHKWIGAPLGCGLVYIRKQRIRDIDRFMNEPGADDDIRRRAHLGAHNFAAHLTIPAALDFHETIGISEKEARLRYLRHLWTDVVRDIPSIDILTSDDPRTVCALTSFRLRGRTSTDDNNAIVQKLKDQHSIFTVRRTGPAGGDCVRITPAIYNSADDVARIAPALAMLE